MGFQKLTGSQAILGGATILTAPTIYGAPTALTTTASTGVTKIYGVPEIENTTTDSTFGGIKLGGVGVYTKQIALTATQLAVTTSLTDTGWDIPYKAVVESCWFESLVAATSAGHTLSAGVGGGGNVANLIVATPCDAVETHQIVIDVDSVFMNGTTTLRIGSVPFSVSALTSSRSVTVTRNATAFTSTWTGILYIKYVLPE